MEKVMDELIAFLDDKREELRREAATTVAGLTGSVEGIGVLMTKSDALFPALLKHVHDESAQVGEQVYATLVNLSLDEAACKRLLNIGVVERLMEILRNSTKKPDAVANMNLTAKLLSNLTLHSVAIDKLLQKGKGPLEGFFVTWIVQALAACDDEARRADLEYFAAVLTNVSQDPIGRKVLFDSDGANMKTLNKELRVPQSAFRRECLCQVVRNAFVGCAKDDAVAECIASEAIQNCVAMLSDTMGKGEEEHGLTVSCRRSLLEGILCLAGCEEANKVLWSEKVPEILQKIYETETDEDVNEVLESCANVFIEESGPAPWKPLPGEERKKTAEQQEEEKVGTLEELD